MGVIFHRSSLWRLLWRHPVCSLASFWWNLGWIFRLVLSLSAKTAFGHSLQLQQQITARLRLKLLVHMLIIPIWSLAAVNLHIPVPWSLIKCHSAQEQTCLWMPRVGMHLLAINQLILVHVILLLDSFVLMDSVKLMTPHVLSLECLVTTFVSLGPSIKLSITKRAVQLLIQQ